MINQDLDNIKESKLKNIDIRDNRISNSNDILNDNVLISLKKELKLLEEKILECKIYNKEEIIKISNRSNQDIKKVSDFCLEKIIVSLLSIIDNLECTLILLKNKINEEKYSHIYKKIKLIFNTLIELLKKYHVKAIDQIHVLFNPQIHQAMSVQCNNILPVNHVIEIMQKGYILHESRLLRPAMVVVSKK